MINVTNVWCDILNYNQIMFDENQPLKLVNLTTSNIVATGKTPSELLDAYFAKQIFDMDKNNLQKA